ncbi:putative germin-like protein 2-1 [Camellia sinensis]|uniref:putative germin-like protein 2-1 n=1 Tax=Camellia sinensis TaxID=4442 RepID=UPI0010356F8A|nr:putative germin-like protein 2-1 [Camellia sinensis]
MEAIPHSSAVGSLMCVMRCTRLDIGHAVGVVSRFLANPGKEHCEVVKWILRYLKGTLKMCLCFGGAKPILEEFTDVDMAGDLDGRKSTSGFLFTFAGRAEEYKVHYDSQSAIDLSKNSMYHSRSHQRPTGSLQESDRDELQVRTQLHFFCIVVFVNGKVCNDPKLATADDFFFSGLLTPQNTSNPIGSKVTPVNVIQILGLNTLGISLARIDFAPYGLNPPHTHPRATEVIVVLEGTLYVGFVTSNTDNRLFTKVLYPGDVFVFPQGLIHFQFNNGKTNAVALAALSSQNPGTITVANAVFGSNPRISDDVLAKAFQVDKKVVDYLQAQFWWPSN